MTHWQLMIHQTRWHLARFSARLGLTVLTHSVVPTEAETNKAAIR